MATVAPDPAPIQHPIADRQTLLVPLPWALWFNKLSASGGGQQPAFGVINVQGWDQVDATQPFDTLTLVAGLNISLETNALAKSVTINADGGGDPADPDTSVQFNDGGVFGGNAAFLFKKLVTSVLVGTGHDEGTTGSANVLIGEGHTVL